MQVLAEEAPLVVEYVPAVQAMQTTATSIEYLPGTHLVQTVSPATEYAIPKRTCVGQFVPPVEIFSIRTRNMSNYAKEAFSSICIRKGTNAIRRLERIVSDRTY